MKSGANGQAVDIAAEKFTPFIQVGEELQSPCHGFGKQMQ
jgi:hypothetical protein